MPHGDIWPQFRFYKKVNYLAQKVCYELTVLKRNFNLALHIFLLLVPLYFCETQLWFHRHVLFDSDQCQHKTWEWS